MFNEGAEKSNGGIMKKSNGGMMKKSNGGIEKGQCRH